MTDQVFGDIVTLGLFFACPVMWLLVLARWWKTRLIRSQMPAEVRILDRASRSYDGVHVNDLSEWEGFGGTRKRPSDPPPIRPNEKP